MYIWAQIWQLIFSATTGAIFIVIVTLSPLVSESEYKLSHSRGFERIISVGIGLFVIVRCFQFQPKYLIKN